MRIAPIIIVPALAVLSGCHWVLPEPKSPEGAAAPRSAACTLDLAQSRRSTLTRIAAAGSARPLIISLSSRATEDRLLRNGVQVELCDLETAGDAGASPLPLTILAVGVDASVPAPIRDGSLIRLRAAADASALAAPVRIHKVDVPDPNRPTSCDAQLRDGDFVLLRSESPSAWLELNGGRLAVAAGPAVPGCARSKEHCYTDRRGGLLCVRYLDCATPD